MVSAMDMIEVFVLVAVYSQSVTTVATQPTLATCEAQRAEFAKQVHPRKPGLACVRDRRWYISDFGFKEIP